MTLAVIHFMKIVLCYWFSFNEKPLLSYQETQHIQWLNDLPSWLASFFFLLWVAEAWIGHQSSTSATSTCADTNPQPALVLLLWCTCPAIRFLFTAAPFPVDWAVVNPFFFFCVWCSKFLGVAGVWWASGAKSPSGGKQKANEWDRYSTTWILYVSCILSFM